MEFEWTTPSKRGRKPYGKIKIVNNPFDLVIEATHNLYPHLNCKIQFNPELRGKEFGECGTCTVVDNEILIDISTNIPFDAMIEIIAHELAHAVVGKTNDENKHSKEWEDIFDKIFEKYLEIGEKKFA